MITGMILCCLACGHEWYWNPGMGMEMGAFIARMRAESICPHCGNHSKARSKSIVLLQGEILKASAEKLGVPWIEEIHESS